MTTQSRLLAVALLVASAVRCEIADSENAALLYYRAMWVFQTPHIVELFLSTPEDVAPRVRHRYLVQTEGMSSLLKRAGTLTYCDWGIQGETNETGYGPAGLADQLRTLSYVAVQRFQFALIEQPPLADADLDLAASLNIAKHLSLNPPLAISDVMRAAIIQRSLNALAANIGRLPPGARKRVVDLVETNDLIFQCDVPAIIAGAVNRVERRLKILETRPDISRELVIKELLHDNISVPPERVNQSTVELLVEARKTMEMLVQIAPVYRSEKSVEVDAAVRKRVAGLNPPLPVEEWLDLFAREWRICREIEVVRELFLSGVQAVDEKSTVSDSVLGTLTTKYEVQRFDDGFELEDHSGPDSPVMMRFDCLIGK